MVDLRYDTAADVAVLRDFEDHLRRISALTRRSGTQLALFREELGRRLGPVTNKMASSKVALLDSCSDPIIQQLESLLPEDAKIERLGMLAPFYERDDDSELAVNSVFGALKHRLSASAVLDVGVAWDKSECWNCC